MALPKYNAKRRQEIASALGIDEQYLYQILNQIRVPSPALARKFNQIDPKAHLKDLRPKDWKEIWPEFKTNSSIKLETNKVRLKP